MVAKLEKGKCLWHMGYSRHFVLHATYTRFISLIFFSSFAMEHRLNFIARSLSLALSDSPSHSPNSDRIEALCFLCALCTFSVSFLALLRRTSIVDCNFT